MPHYGVTVFIPSPTPSDNPALSVTPINQDVTRDGGATTFSVANIGTGTMSWTAAVTSGEDWLSITSGESGSNAGTIICAFDANTTASSRTGTIQVTATGATGSPVDVTVTQAEETVLTLTGLSISGPSSVNENSTTTYTANATWSDNTISTVTPSWIENSAYALISAAGLLTTTEVQIDQAVTVTAIYASGGIIKSATMPVVIVNVSVGVMLNCNGDSGKINRGSQGVQAGCDPFDFENMDDYCELEYLPNRAIFKVCDCMPEIWETVVASDIIDIRMDILIDAGNGAVPGDNGVYWAEDMDQSGIPMGTYNYQSSACESQYPYNGHFNGVYEYLKADGGIGAPLTGVDSNCGSLTADNRVVTIRPVDGQSGQHGYEVSQEDEFNGNCVWVIDIPKMRIDPARISGGEKVWVKVSLTLDCTGTCSTNSAVCCSEIYIGELGCGAELPTVQKLFIGYYLRPAAPAGLLFWAEKWAEEEAKPDGSIKNVIEAFANTPESQAIWEGDITEDTIEAFIDKVFMSLFGRHPQQAGIDAYHTGFTNGDFTPGTIVYDIFVGAPEGSHDKAVLDKKLEFANAFTGILEQNPDDNPENDQATYSGQIDAAIARDMLADVDEYTVIDSAAIKQQIMDQIADPGDPILENTAP